MIRRLVAFVAVFAPGPDRISPRRGAESWLRGTGSRETTNVSPDEVNQTVPVINTHRRHRDSCSVTTAFRWR
jgi:hypothetical protein